MHTLLLCLAGPLQSWGVQSRFEVRDTGLEPSKSGVVGLLCAALGRPRTAAIDDLAGLRMGARADREGIMARDYHVAQQVLKASGGIKPTQPSNRYYLAEAAFLVGLEGPELGLLQLLHDALRDPVWPLYLGRKAFVPGEPVWLAHGLCEDTELRAALETYPWHPHPGQKPPDRLRLVLEDENGREVRPDQPLSFAERTFAPRRVTTSFIDLSGFESLTGLESPGGEL